VVLMMTVPALGGGGLKAVVLMMTVPALGELPAMGLGGGRPVLLVGLSAGGGDLSCGGGLLGGGGRCCCCCWAGGSRAAACAAWQNQAVSRALVQVLPGSQHLSGHTASWQNFAQLPEMPPHCWPGASHTLQPGGPAEPRSWASSGEGEGEHCQ
jgi:hypothetical protein